MQFRVADVRKGAYRRSNHDKEGTCEVHITGWRERWVSIPSAAIKPASPEGGEGERAEASRKEIPCWAGPSRDRNQPSVDPLGCRQITVIAGG